jgi:hypothetical protein
VIRCPLIAAKMLLTSVLIIHIKTGVYFFES